MSERSKKDKKDLTVSQVDRQNILNNPYALKEIEKAARIQGIPFEGKRVVTKEQVAAFFDVTPRTIDNHIKRHGEELRQNGYEVLRGKRLKSLKLEISKQGANETDFVTKTTVLGIFDFRAFLNIGMLIGESERARLLRQMILDIVIDTINQRTGGGTKYINQRDEDKGRPKLPPVGLPATQLDAIQKEIVELGYRIVPYYHPIIALTKLVENISLCFGLWAGRLDITRPRYLWQKVNGNLLIISGKAL
jgi:hypothetical protein